MVVSTFRDLKVWEKAHNLVLMIYKISGKFPAAERYGLTSQLRRSAASVPTNISEGYKRRSRREYAHFLNYAESSLEETKYHIILGKDLGYIEDKVYKECVSLCDEVGRMLNAMYNKLIK